MEQWKLIINSIQSNAMNHSYKIDNLVCEVDLNKGLEVNTCALKEIDGFKCWQIFSW